MVEHAQRTALPPGKLGGRRNLEVGYFGHGDIIISSWQGALEHEPHSGDGVTNRFGFVHGSDVEILAALTGFLRRLGRKEEEVREVLSKAGQDILTDDSDSIDSYHSLQDDSLDMIAQGATSAHFDIEEQNLRCLVPPIPTRPGIPSKTGGTAIYTRHNPLGHGALLTLGKHKAARDPGEILPTDTEDFCESDIPAMAKLVCDLALGEYRKDIHAFLVRQLQ